eukprot:1090590-Rhodomonas_salina.2
MYLDENPARGPASAMQFPTVSSLASALAEQMKAELMRKQDTYGGGGMEARRRRDGREKQARRRRGG